MTRAALHRATAALAGLALVITGCAAEHVETAPPGENEPAAEPAQPDTETQPDAETEPGAETEREFDTTLYSLDDPMSIWVVLNKQRPMNPIDFEPTDLVSPEGVPNLYEQPLRKPAAEALRDLYDAATAEGLSLRITSAYRPHSLQVGLYGSYVDRDGKELADTYSARPGHSEHQTGLTVDLDDWSGCYLDACFGETTTGLWLQEHAHEYGFMMRYPHGLTHVTGFTYEPWHYRFVGVELATELHETGVQTLEEFFDLGPAPDYLPDSE